MQGDDVVPRTSRDVTKLESALEEGDAEVVDDEAVHNPGWASARAVRNLGWASRPVVHNLGWASRFVVVVLAIVATAGCPHRIDGPDVSTLTDAQVKMRLEQSAARRQTLQGVIKARLPGLEGVVVNATVDVAARVVASGADLNVAVRSFFEVPQQVLVSRNVNGVGEVTLYDATSGAPRFYRGPANERTLAKVLGVPVTPDDAVALLLSRPPLDMRPGWPPARVRLVAVDEEKGTYSASIERAGRGAVVVVVDAKNDALVSLEMARGDGRQLVSATFGDVVVDAGVPWAKKVTLTVADTGQQVIFELREATFNAAIDDDAFVLTPPEGTRIDPL